MIKGAWVTLATNDSYSLGALVLAHSLKQVGTQKELAILVTPGVTNSMRARLSEVFNSVKEVNILDSRDKANLRLLQRPELGITFTKLHCWQLTEYEKCVFLDADTLVLQNCDELFEREELSAAPDVGWPDCFNSGVFVYRPSETTYNNLIQFALDKGSFDGGDQGLLNLYFSDWARKDISKHLPFIYNVCSTAFYSYLPAFKQFGKDVKIIHFIGNAKPWLQYFDTESKRVRPSRDLGHLEPILQSWWNIFCSMIHPNLTSDMISSYPSEPVSARCPDPSPHHPPNIDHPVPFDCTNDRPTVWDPWEEYDRNQLNVTLHSSEPLESHNTIALSPVASDHPCIDCSSPAFDESPVDRNDQHYIDNQTDLQNCENDRHCIEQFPVSSFEEGSIVSYPSYDTQEEFCHINNEIVQCLTSVPVPIVQKENIVSAIPIVPIFENNPSHLTTHSPEIITFEIEVITPERIPSPISIVLSKNETEEDCYDVPWEEDNDEQESGLAGAFAKLTLGQQRTPEQEALENSLRRQNWEQGNIDYLGKDSFDNIWSKICETLAKGPQEDEGENSTQLKSDELVLATPQQESCPILKEGVVSASQEAAVPDSAIEIQKKATSDPIPLPPSPGIVELPKMPIPQIPEKVSTPEVVSTTTKDDLPEEKIEPKISSIPTGAIPIESKIVEQIPLVEESSKSGSATEIKSAAEETSKAVEQAALETISSQQIPLATEEISKPQDVPVPTESASSEKTQPLLSQNVTSVEKQDRIPSTPLVPAKPEDISTDISSTASQGISSTDPALPVIQQSPLSTQQVTSTAEPISPVVAACPLEGAPPSKETPSSPAPQVLEQAVLKDTPTSPLPAEHGPISETTSCILAKASAPVEPPKPEQFPPVKGIESLGETTEEACNVEKAPPTTQPAVLQQAPPQPPVIQQAPPQPAVLPQASPQPAVLQQVPPPPATTTTVPIAAQEKVSAPVLVDPASQASSTATPTSTVASSEPPPPIAPPPRKNGGNKKQNKSKK